MMISTAKIWDKLFILFILVVTAGMILAPISSETTLPKMMDYYNHVGAIVQAKLALAEKQFPLRIAPLESRGWRYPYFQFYSPTTYTIAGLVYDWITPANPITAYLLTVWLALIAGGIYMFKLVKQLFSSSQAALLTSVVYFTTPYYIVVVDHLGGLSEAVALGMVPIVLFYTLQRYFNPTQNKTLLQTALVWYLLATIHIVTFAYTTLTVGILLLFVTLKKRQNWMNLIDTGIAYSFGFILALWYLAPAYICTKFLMMQKTLNSAKSFFGYSSSFSCLVSPGINLTRRIQSGNVNQVTQLHPGLGLPLVFAAGVCFYALFSSVKIENEKLKLWRMPLLLLFTLVFLFVWAPFDISSITPSILLIGQYSWRILGQINWIGSLLFAWALCWFFQNKLDKRHVALGLFLILSASSVWLSTAETTYTTVNIPELVEFPFLLENENAYLINLRDNLGMVRNIDTLSLGSVFGEKRIMPNRVYKLPVLMIQGAYKPVVVIEGEILKDKKFPFQKMSLFANGLKLSTMEVKTGKFAWKTPLDLKKLDQKKQFIDLEFKTNKKADANDALDFNDGYLSGFLNDAAYINVDQAKTHCQQKKTRTICQYPVSSKIKLIELPVLYYPDLLKVTLNGRVVPYENILYRGFLLTAIKPDPNQLNTVKVEFRGLVWANILSEAGWITWLIFLVYILINRFSKKTLAEERL